MNKNNILLLNYEYPPLGGGAGNATSYLIKEFASNPCLNISLVTSSTTTYRVEHPSENITIYFLNIRKKGSLHYQSITDLVHYTWKAWRFCKKLTARENFNLIHAFFSIPCGLIALGLRLPYIISLRGSDVPFYNPRFYWLDKLILKHLHGIIWRNAKRVIANSSGLRKLALQSFPKQKIEVIPNGVDIKTFSPPKSKPKNVRLQLISIGRLIERKGYSYLIEALEGLQGIDLTLIGDGDQMSHLKHLAQKKEVSVRFLGRIPHNKLPQHLQNADVFILPSLNEGMSNAALEAMACGLPIIITDTGGALELIRGNGLVVPPGDSKALQKAIIHYRQKPSLVHSEGLTSREISKTMSWQQVAKAYRITYQDVTEKL